MAYAASIEDDKGQFALVQRFIFMPMFLFSGTFYPLDDAAALAAVDRLDLAALARDRARPVVHVRRDRAELAMIVVHFGYLIVLTVVGCVLGRRDLRAEAREMSAATQRRMRAAPRAAACARCRRATPARWCSAGCSPRALELGRGALGLLRAGLLPALDGHRPRRPHRHGRDDHGHARCSYAAFIAPALLAVSAMNGAIYDSTWNVFFKMQLRQALRGDAVDLARAARCRARRDPLRAAARRCSTPPAS